MAAIAAFLFRMIAVVSYPNRVMKLITPNQ